MRRGILVDGDFSMFVALFLPPTSKCWLEKSITSGNVSVSENHRKSPCLIG